MAESQYNRKALEEVIKLADEKINSVEDYFLKQEDTFNDFIKGSDDTMKDLNIYFTSLQKQLEKWKSVYLQDLRQDTANCETLYERQRTKVNECIDKLKESRDQSARIISTGQVTNCDQVYTIHNLLYKVDEHLKDFTQVMSDCMPLKFIGRLNLDSYEKSEMGTLEKLADFSTAEILPIKLPKIKLGQLFYINFRISKRFCDAMKKYVSFTVTKSDDRIKVGSYLQDNRDGTFTLSFPITAIVPHTVNIYFLGEHIRNSPYTILFKVGNGQTGATSGGTVPDPNAHMGDDKDVMRMKHNPHMDSSSINVHKHNQ